MKVRYKAQGTNPEAGTKADAVKKKKKKKDAYWFGLPMPCSSYTIVGYLARDGTYDNG